MAVQEFKCPTCGGSVVFSSEKQKMVCEYCGSEFEVGDPALTAHNHTQTYESEDDGKVHDHDHDHEGDHDHDHGPTVGTAPDSMEINWDKEETTYSAQEESGLYVYTCNSCGGEIVGDSTMASTSCPFCNNKVVIPSQFKGDLKPDLVIPFKMDKEAAKRALKKSYEGKKLLPRVFVDENHIDEIKGLYVPFWLYSGTAYADLLFDAVQVRTWRDSNYNYTETFYYEVTRDGNMDFLNVPVDGSSKMSDLLMQSIEPFNWEEGVVFNSGYLAGYLANRYDMEAEECVDVARERIKNTTIQKFTDSVRSYNNATLKSSHFELKEGKINYALAPVWVLNTIWDGKKYTFAMNAQTGRFAGDDLPVDNALYWKYFIMIAGVVGVIVFIAMMLIYPNL